MRRSRKSSPLPVRNGVSPQSVWLPAGPWPTVLAFLCERFPQVSTQQWQQRMAVGDVVDARGEALTPTQPYQPGQRIHYYRQVDAEIMVPFQETILFEDDHLLVVDKPHFLLTQPSGAFLQETLVTRLRCRLDNDALEPIHRLDRETAGLVLLSKRRDSRGRYQALFRDQQISKTYEAIAPFRPDLVFPLIRSSRIEVDEQFFRRCEVPGPPNAETRIELLEQQGHWARYRLQPRTGKTHQLRVHLAALGIPIRHDPLYPQDRQRAPDDFSAPLQLLACALDFVDPLSGSERRFRSQLTLQWPPG